MENDRRILILYGSQTGTAQDYAEQLRQDALRRRFAVTAFPMDEYSVQHLPTEPVVLFICSTTGDGEEPDNMKRFWRYLLRRSLSSTSLNGVRFASLGLGDSSYQKFNFAAKKLFRRLEQLGGEPLVPLALADDQDDLGPDAVAVPWIDNLWEVLMKLFPLPDHLSVIPDETLLPPKFKVIWESEDSFSTNDSYYLSSGAFNQRNPFFSTLTGNHRLTAVDHFQDTRLISVDIEGSGLSYSPGDVVMIQPENLEESVSLFIVVMGLEPQTLERKFSLEPTEADVPLPPVWLLSCTSVRVCIQRFWDLQRVPSRSFFRLLASLASDEMEKERLQEFADAEHQQEFFDYCTRPRRTVAEVLRDFPQTAKRIPFAYLFDLLRPIQPRSFSIASCQQIHQNELQLLVAVVEYRTRMASPRLGLCSNWLSRLSLGAQVPIWVKKGTFVFPDSSVPCVLIGPGTGIAPFRSFVHQRAAQAASAQSLVFFGCRNQAKDFYFENEWKELSKDGFCSVFAAFSRDQPQKIYVQDKIRENGQLISDHLKNNGYFFVAGNAKQMPKDVMDCLQEVLSCPVSPVTAGDLSSGGADFLALLQRQRRLQFETWS